MSLLRKKERQKVQEEALSFPKMFLSSFAVGITNPAVILTFLFAFSWLGISGGLSFGSGLLLVLGVFAGTYLWWGALTFAASLAGRKAAAIDPVRMNRVFGVLLCLLGIGICFR